MNLEEFYISNDLETPVLGHEICGIEEAIYRLSNEVYKESKHSDLESLQKYSMLHVCPSVHRFNANWFTGENY